jgi:Fic family protein
MKNSLNKVDKLANSLQSLLPFDKEVKKKLDKKFRLEFNYNSNHIEGNTLTYSETELLLYSNETMGYHTLREYEQMKGHDLALNLVEELASNKEAHITESDIKNLNKIILKEAYWKDAITPSGENTKRKINIGEYKKYPNSVRLPNDEMFEYPSPAETPILMHELIDWYRKEETKMHPIKLAAMLHYKFVRIHPFDDGNGRIARLLMNYVLLKSDIPPVIIKSSDKQNYLTFLHLADGGNYELFIDYIARLAIWSLEISIKAANGENIEEDNDLDKQIHLLEKEFYFIDPDEVVKVQFNKKVLLDIFQTSIKDLVFAAIPIVQKFNHFFTGTSHKIHLQPGIAYAEFINENPTEVWEKLMENYISSGERYQEHNVEFNFYTFYGTFTPGGLKTFGCNYGFQIKFDTIKYEIFIDEFDENKPGRTTVKLFEHLLHKPLAKGQIDSIVNSLGQTILTHIDKTSKLQGIR